MKTNNIFDYMEFDVENIDESTVYETTGVKKENVREILMSKINNGTSEKKTGRANVKRRVTITLIAAAAAAALLGTTAAATGSFNSAFGKMFAGEPANGVYSGGKVTAKSDKLNIEFGGIVGDSDNVWGMMKLTNSDGSPFVETKDGVFVQSDYMVASYGLDTQKIQCTKSLLDSWMHKNSPYAEVTYQLEDADTIRAIIYYGDDESNIIGETLTAKETDIVIYRVDEVLYSWEEMQNAYNTIPEDDKFWSNGGFYEKAVAEHKSDLKENQEVGYSEKGLSLMTKVTSNLGYEVSVKLNYKDSIKTFSEVEGKEITFDGKTQTVGKLEVQPFTMKLSLYELGDFRVADDYVHDYEAEMLPSELDNLTIETDDGKVYTAHRYASQGSADEKHQEDTLTYQFYVPSDNVSADPDYMTQKQAVINPEQIIGISYNGKYILDKR